MVNITPEMQNRAVASFGNPYRILKLFERAKNKESISFVSIGGSITEGACASKQQNIYANRIALWLKSKFPECEIKFENAGIGATDSIIALHRLKQDVFKYEPDFVVVDFSVNENDDYEYKLSYDNLIYNLLNYKTKPAVLLLCFMTDSGGNAQYAHSLVGNHYNLPIISYRDALFPEIEAGNTCWSDLAADFIHPNDNGHKAAAELVCGYLQKLLSLSSKDYCEEEYKTHLTSSRYLNARIFYPQDLEPFLRGCFQIEDVDINKMPKGWIAHTNGDPLVYKFEKVTRIFVLFEKTNRGDGGKAIVDVNGNQTELDSDFADGWGIYSNHIMVFDSENPQEVTLKITPLLQEKKRFTVIGIMVS